MYYFSLLFIIPRAPRDAVAHSTWRITEVYMVWRILAHALHSIRESFAELSKGLVSPPPGAVRRVEVVPGNRGSDEASRREWVTGDKK